MNWDGEGRRPLRDRQSENKDLRQLTVALMKLREVALIENLDIEPGLKAALLRGWHIDEFRGKRRQERTIVNELREAEEEDIHLLLELTSDPEQAEANLRERIDELYQDLVKNGNDALNSCIEEYNINNIQYLRQLIRNAKKAEGSHKTAPREKLIQFLEDLVFGLD